MNNKHMEFGKLERIKTVKKLRGVTDSLRKEGENQSTSQQDQLTTLFIKQIQKFSFVHLIEWRLNFIWT